MPLRNNTYEVNSIKYPSKLASYKWCITNNKKSPIISHTNNVWGPIHVFHKRLLCHQNEKYFCTFWYSSSGVGSKIIKFKGWLTYFYLKEKGNDSKQARAHKGRHLPLNSYTFVGIPNHVGMYSVSRAFCFQSKLLHLLWVCLNCQ